MKKSVVYLGVALLAFANVSLASNFNSLTVNKSIITTYVGVTPLCIAISKGDCEAVKKFIDYGADVNEKSNGMTPLMIAARYNKVEIIKILLSKGANLNVKDGNGFTALKHAELSSAFSAIQILKQV
jgi:ankyrin repeat protein